MSGEDDGTIPFKRLGHAMGAPRLLVDDEISQTAIKLEAELTQLRFENKWLRDANKALSTALDEARKPLPPEALV